MNLGKFPSIPLLTGVIKDETGGAIAGGYREEVENKLKTIPDFLQKELVASLQGSISIFDNTTKRFVPGAFSKYLSVANIEKNLEKGLKKVTEAVNDAVFNAPAFLTVRYWSQKAKSFLYSFDAKKTTKKNNFLDGLPLADAKDSSNEIPGHGDDLGYIFGENDILGNRIGYNDEDTDVTEAFTGLIAQFARSGDIQDNAKTRDYLPGNSYISITDKIQPMENFQFCGMALWTDAAQMTDTAPNCDEQLRQFAELSIDKIENVGGKVIPEAIPTLGPIKTKPKLPNVPKGLPNIPSFGFLG